MYSIVYGWCTNTTDKKLETFPEFAPINKKHNNESAILLLEIIKSICCNFVAEKNKVLAAIQIQKKAMSWRKSEGSTIAYYNYQFMNRASAAKSRSRIFQLPGVIDIALKEKYS